MIAPKFPTLVSQHGWSRALFALALGAHAPLVLMHFWQLWRGGLHSHFPLVLLAIFGILRTRWVGRATPNARRRIAAGACVLLGLIVLGVATLLWSPWLGCVAATITLAGACFHLAPCSWRDWVPAWCLFGLLVPAPFGLDRHFSAELQGYSSRAASLLLDFFRINHVRSGNVLEIPGEKFAIEEACSGIHGLYVLVAFAAILAVWARRSLPHSVVLLVAGAVWAATANALRVAGVVLAADRFQVDLAHGWLHDGWGLATFAGALLLLLSTDQLAWFLLQPSTEFPDEADEEPEDHLEEEEDLRETDEGTGQVGEEVGRSSSGSSSSTEVSQAGASWGTWTITAAFGLLFVGQLFPRGKTPELRLTPLHFSVAHVGAETLPATIQDWRRVGFETERRGADHSDGEFSAIWRYERPGRQAIISLDFPFRDWHQVSACYRGRGCQIESWSRTFPENSSSDSLGIAVASLKLEQGLPAALAYVEWNDQGRWLAPPSTELPTASSFAEQFWRRWNRQLAVGGDSPVVFQLQVLETPSSPRVGQPIQGGSLSGPSTRELLAAALLVLRPLTLSSGGPH